MPTQPVIQIGKVVQHARLFNAQHWQGEARTMDDLLQAVDALFIFSYYFISAR